VEGEDAAAEIRALKRRNAELEQTNVILKAATSFFVRESDPRNCG
jgi:transposase-like protein